MKNSQFTKTCNAQKCITNSPLIWRTPTGTVGRLYIQWVVYLFNSEELPDCIGICGSYNKILCKVQELMPGFMRTVNLEMSPHLRSTDGSHAPCSVVFGSLSHLLSRGTETQINKWAKTSLKLSWHMSLIYFIRGGVISEQVRVMGTEFMTSPNSSR